MRVVKPWPRLPREAVAVPSLAGFKAKLDGALSTLGWWNMSLLMAGQMEPDELQGPSQPKPFSDSMKSFQEAPGGTKNIQAVTAKPPSPENKDPKCLYFPHRVRLKSPGWKDDQVTAPGSVFLHLKRF